MIVRIAVVDMGSNTLKFSVTEVGEDGNQRILESQAQTIRLGAGIAESAAIAPERYDRALEAMRYFEMVALAFGATVFLSVGTAALRIASNGQSLIDDIEASTQWPVRLVSGDEEARLAFAGVVGVLPPSGTSLLLDIGGASTEAVRVVDRDLREYESNQIGSGTLADASFTNDPPGNTALATAIATATDQLQHSGVIKSSINVPMVLSGGNGLFLAELSAWDQVAIPFEPDAFPDLLNVMAAMPAARTATFLGIAEERARMLPAGAAIVQAVINIAQPASMTAVPSGIRGGLVQEWLAQQSAEHV